MIINESRLKSEEDRRQKEQAILRNRLEGLFQTTSKTFNEFGWLLAENDQNFARDSLKAAKVAFDGNPEEINYQIVMQDLEQAAALLTQAMFSSPASSGRSGQTPKPNDPLSSWLNNSTGSGQNKT
jgi:molecular chaperone DnaK (HSP70)